MKEFTLFSCHLIGSTTPPPSACTGRLHREKKDLEIGKEGAVIAEGSRRVWTQA